MLDFNNPEVVAQYNKEWDEERKKIEAEHGIEFMGSKLSEAYEKLGPEHIVKEIPLKNGTIFTVYDAIIN